MVSIIIPCKSLWDATECIDKCLELNYPYFEVIVLPDFEDSFEAHEYGMSHNRLRVIYTGNKLPAYKRDIGIKEAQGDIIAFIDSDAYPREDWLMNAVNELRSTENLAGVCGPGIIPTDCPGNERAADIILQHLPFSYRVRPESARYVKDYPTFNLILKKEHVLKVGGFSCNYLTGEDTLLCAKLLKYGKILYSPDVVVYHRRRALLVPFLRQIAIYGRHRGYFFKRGIGDSRKWIYVMPSLSLILLLALSACILFMR